jgi:phosphohistidine swiveling domain-containing protein
VHPDVRPIEALLPRKAAAFGGKARGLATLVRAGFAVPAGFAISAAVAEEAMARALPARDRIGALLEAPARELGSERLTILSETVRGLTIPRAEEEAIRAGFRTLQQDGAAAVAVRSSALHEDHAQRSGAGLYETVLGVTTEAALLDAIRAVWASALSPRVIAYLRALGVRAHSEHGGVGVVVQALVPAEVSGVMFTVNPLSGDAEEIVVNAAYGLGSAVVDGRVSPDTYRVDKASGWVRDHIVGEKARATRLVGGALVEEDVPEADRAREALSAGRVAELAVLAQRIEQTFGDARDVEWALAGSSIFVLQARPVTALPSHGSGARRRPRRARDRSKILWSNVNVGEALPGVATPLTWSILSAFSDTGFRRAFGALGCSVPADAELVGNFRGRIYLNLSDFFSIASQVPGISPRTILALGGGGELAGETFEVAEDTPSAAGFVARLPITAARFARENFQITRRVEAFERAFAADRDRLRAIDLRLLSSTAVHRVLLEVERLLDQSGQVLLNVYGNLLATVVGLRTVVGFFAKRGERSDAFFRELLSGLLDVDSAGPGLELARIAETARREPEARAYLLACAPDKTRVEELPVGPTRGLMVRFLELYGDRGTREAEIAEPRWREDATLPFATLRLHLLREADAGLDLERRQREIRERAQFDLERRVPRPARFAVRRLLALVQRFLRMREKLRAHVVTVLGLFREVALDASRRMRAMEPGVGDDGAFFLSLPELHGVLRGDVPTVGDLVRSRRLQLQRDAALPAPPDTFVGLPPPLAPPEPAMTELRGLGACAGRVVGSVRLMQDPADVASFRPGEILLAQQTDVGWSPLFLVAGGVITELGGPLSHASIVAREFGVATVVNVKRATSVLRTGDRVELDGERGTVRLLERSG